MGFGIGDRFQKETRYERHRMPQRSLDHDVEPEIYKAYPNAAVVNLTPMFDVKTSSVRDALKARKSIRQFQSKSLDPQQLSFLLWAANGVQRSEHGYEFRTAPSAGALYPIETYVVVNHAEGIGNGVYHYSPKQHLLHELKRGDFGQQVAHAALGQAMCAHVSVVFVWTAVFRRSKWKYGERAYRYVYLDAGHIAENLALGATSIGLGTCQVGALYDHEVNEIVDIDGKNESVIYMSVVGYPAQ